MKQSDLNAASPVMKWVLIAAVVSAFAAAYFFLPISEWLSDFQKWVQGFCAEKRLPGEPPRIFGNRLIGKCKKAFPSQWRAFGPFLIEQFKMATCPTRIGGACCSHEAKEFV